MRNYCVMYLILFQLLRIACSSPNPAPGTHLQRPKRTFEAGDGGGSKGAAGGNAVRAPPPPARGAVFATENSTAITAQVGGTARLPCVVRKFNAGVVNWIRVDTTPPRILTIGLATHSADDRFLVEHARHLQNWGLVIQHVRPHDAGLYECQVSTHPAASIFIKLRVTVASAEIVGAPDLHIRAGSVLRLVCTILHSTEPPQYVFWYHDQKMINHEPGVAVSVDSDATSILQLQEADATHSGNYTCHPSNAVRAHINVHVLNATEEENPAAMLHASSSSISGTLFFGIVSIVIMNLFLSNG